MVRIPKSIPFCSPQMRAADILLQEIAGSTVVIKRNYWRTGDAANLK